MMIESHCELRSLTVKDLLRVNIVSTSNTNKHYVPHFLLRWYVITFRGKRITKFRVANAAKNMIQLYDRRVIKGEVTIESLPPF